MNLFGNLNDLLHPLNGDGVFLSCDHEADQLQFIVAAVGVFGGFARFRAGHSCAGCCLVADQRGELRFNEPGEVQNHHHFMAADVLDHAQQKLGINRGLNSDGVFDLLQFNGDDARHSVHHETGRRSEIITKARVASSCARSGK